MIFIKTVLQGLSSKNYFKENYSIFSSNFTCKLSKAIHALMATNNSKITGTCTKENAFFHCHVYPHSFLSSTHLHD